jgi:hypothetical protein
LHIQLIRIAVLALLAIAACLIFLWFSPVFGEGPNIFFAELSNMREIATPPADLLDARTRWMANPIKHYRLQVKHSFAIWPTKVCEQDVEVLNEVVVSIFKDDCPNNSQRGAFTYFARTVSELFDKFQTETTTIFWHEPNNPDCPYIQQVAITYSPAGYPVSAAYSKADALPWTLGPKTYRALYGGGLKINRCLNQITRGDPRILVTLQLLP